MRYNSNGKPKEAEIYGHDMTSYRERIPCDPNRACLVRDNEGCHEDIHHEQYYARWYRTKLERAFRDHILNKVLICRDLHNEKHATEDPPQKPTIKEMQEFLGVTK